MYGGRITEGRDSLWLIENATSSAVDLLANNEQPQNFNGKTINQWLDENTIAFHVHAGTGVQYLFNIDLPSRSTIQYLRSESINANPNLSVLSIPVIAHSSDSNYISYIDTKNRLWLISLLDKCQQQITETQSIPPIPQWSSKSNTLALLHDKKLEILQIQSPPTLSR